MPFRVSVVIDGRDPIPLEKRRASHWERCSRKQVECTVDIQARHVIVSRLGINPSCLNDKELPKDRILHIRHNDELILIKDKSQVRYHIRFLIHDGPDPEIQSVPTPLSSLKRKRLTPGHPFDDQDHDIINEPRTDDEGDHPDHDDDHDHDGIPRRWRMADFSDESNDIGDWISEDEPPSPPPPPEPIDAETPHQPRKKPRLIPMESIASSIPSTIPVALNNTTFISIATSSASKRATSSASKRAVDSSASKVASDVGRSERGSPTPKAKRMRGEDDGDDGGPTPTVVDARKRGRSMLEEDETVTQRVRGLPESFFAKPEAKAGRGKKGKDAEGGAGKRKGKGKEGDADVEDEGSAVSVQGWTAETRREALERWRKGKEERVGEKRKTGKKKGGEESDGDESVKEEDEEGGGEKASTRKKNDGVKPKGGGGKRGVTAYGLFASIRRSELKKENPLLTSTAITKLLHEEFKALPRDARADLSREATSGPSRSASSPSSSSSDEEQPLIADDEQDEIPLVRRRPIRRTQSKIAAAAKGFVVFGESDGDDESVAKRPRRGFGGGSFVEEEGVGGDDGQSVVMNSNPVKDEPNSSSPPPSPELLSAPLKTTDAPDAWFTCTSKTGSSLDTSASGSVVKTMGMDEMKKEGDATLAKKGKALGIVMPWDDDWGSVGSASGAAVGASLSLHAGMETKSVGRSLPGLLEESDVDDDE